MKKQVFNPFLPSYEYIPDGEPYVFGDRLYVYGSHDKFNGERFCENDYVCWSASLDRLYDWRFEGIIYQKKQDPMNTDGARCLYAPDIQQGPDGRYYLYYALDMLGIMSVAVCDSPAGSFQYYGSVKYPDGKFVGDSAEDIFQFDPGVFKDDDGRIYLYTGFGPEDSEFCDQMFNGRKYEGAYCIELEPDMVTVKVGPKLMIPKEGHANGTSFIGHEFFEASSMRKISNTYYFIYSSINSHELCYATSDRPDDGFVYGGTIISNGDIFLNGRTEDKRLNYTGNNHGSIVEIYGQWYVFYHRQTNKHAFSRQACAEKIVINDDGSIKQVEMTSSGLNVGTLVGKGEYQAYVACNLYSKHGACHISTSLEDYETHPSFTQSGTDREENGDQYIANMQDGAVAGFKYFDLHDTTKISVSVRGNAVGEMIVFTGIGGNMVARIPIKASDNYQYFDGELEVKDGESALFFQFNGTGYLDFASFILN
ncbi:family 43 glycosylhydrolase [Neobacillus niacini]|uniref:family 43 glycosylhydrolase n=1 Tax=Neobacillus niacini TaxID=86668 RepID=UPI002FFE81E7